MTTRHLVHYYIVNQFSILKPRASGLNVHSRLVAGLGFYFDFPAPDFISRATSAPFLASKSKLMNGWGTLKKSTNFALLFWLAVS
jgi:hypothetical protein